MLFSIEKVIGSAFNDTLIGDRGNNTMTGGGGADIFGLTWGTDTITDFKPGLPYAGGDVLIDFEGLTPGPVANGYKGLKLARDIVGYPSIPD